MNGGVYHIHKDLGIHEAVLFGEYFFVEALDKALTALDKTPLPRTVTPYPEDSLPTGRGGGRTGRPRKKCRPRRRPRHDQSEPVSLVTGAGRGIGRGIAVELAKLGHFVVINYAGNAAAADECLALVRAAGGEGMTIRADVSRGRRPRAAGSRSARRLRAASICWSTTPGSRRMSAPICWRRARSRSTV